MSPPPHANSAEPSFDALHITTPLWTSSVAARRLGVGNVYFKMDALQPGGSFKIRGMGRTVSRAVERRPGLTTVVSSSGGNAGLAVTLAGRAFDLAVQVFVPSTTPAFMITRIQDAGATVTVKGSVWDEAHAAAVDYAATLGEAKALLVHPFEGEDTHEGHSTLITEIKDQLPPSVVPSAVICVVGGGGLLCGVLQGILTAWPTAPRPVVVAVETHGAHAYAEALRAGTPVPLPGGITSIAKSLGALQVSSRTLTLRDQYGPAHVRSQVVTDTQAVQGLLALATEFRVLVEPSCGAGVALVYEDNLLKTVVPELGSESNVVVIVCGGSLVTMESVDIWKKMFGL
ncbi:serine dehydratase [Fimicolochytrium jonesii]|uniref:serine dehydratase n=1 Tax=Fimicolochytrium jonesii TaxID=1396493 RepID=UPI0022FEFCEB|nr:serine dehydratase [Fimicolochytrium jonesii]KAI8817997.1 serine dehydratase [Fimicolochytrium jonesii]